jgi:hypothetical protein
VMAAVSVDLAAAISVAADPAGAGREEFTVDSRQFAVKAANC